MWGGDWNKPWILSISFQQYSLNRVKPPARCRSLLEFILDYTVLEQETVGSEKSDVRLILRLVPASWKSACGIALPK